MFRSAAVKLTIWYISVIMTLSLGLSFVIYRLSSEELANNTRRQVYFFNKDLSPSDFSTFARLRQRQLDQGLGRLRADLILFNFFVLTAGGAGSYALARRTLRPLEASLEAQKRFTADASHELRTPLTAMQAEIEVALRDKNLSKNETKNLLESNLEEVGKLKNLSAGLLRLASGENMLAIKNSVSLRGVVTDSLERFTKIAEQKNINIQTQLKNVPAKGDRESLVDLVSILMDNAIKYSPSGSEVTVSIYQKDRSSFIKVSDNGIGIQASELPRIFERFYRADSSRTKSTVGGYGLGLAIAKKITELHNGSIEVKSAPNKGTAFTVRLPAGV
ncbi:HAMP domain-containing histidine kinase [Candidatus Saccharibacteria bacterium]|nr:HAMP domain-containing histidine kinase [Candidatus Saccharibacteria bacterium]